MDVQDYQGTATAYYLFHGMPDNVGDNWHRYICTDGQSCKEVEADYRPQENERVFSCTISGGHVEAVAHKNGAD